MGVPASDTIANTTFGSVRLDNSLKPVATDYAARLVRYRAPAHICNACSIKHFCTASDEGREIEHNPDSWLESEIARFHRGISLALLFLAGLLLVVEMIRPEADRAAHPERLSFTNCVDRIAIVISIFAPRR